MGEENAMPIIDIRGGHSAGKSFLAQLVIGYCGGAQRVMPGCCITQDHDVFSLKTDTGQTKESLGKALVRMQQHKRGIIEGIVSAHTKGRYLELALRPGYTVAYLPTPLPRCKGRVLVRRKATKNKHTGKPPNFVNVVNEYHKVQRVVEWFNGVGASVVYLDWKNPLPQTLEILEIA